MTVTWSDYDSESNSEEESAKLVTALTSVCTSESDTSDEEVTFEELADTYKKLCIRSAEVCVQNEKQSKLIIKLEAEKKGKSWNYKSSRRRSSTAELTTESNDQICQDVDQWNRQIGRDPSGWSKCGK